MVEKEWERICHELATRLLGDNREEKGARVLVYDRETKRGWIRGGGRESRHKDERA